MKPDIDDNFLVDVHHDPIPRVVYCLHGVGEEILGDGLNNVLSELAIIGF